MRFVLLSAIAATLATASLFGSMAPAPTALPPSTQSPRPDGMWGVERIVRELTDAIMRKDIGRVADLIADDAKIRLDNYVCDTITKPTFLGLLNNSGVAAEIIVIMESTVSAGVGLFHYQNAFLTAKGTQFENTTFNRHGILGAVATADGKQLKMLHKYDDSTGLFKNSSAAMAAWYAWANATVDANVPELGAILNSTALYATFEPGAKAATMLNRTMILEGAAYNAVHQQFEKITYDLLYPSCEVVVSLLTAYTARKDGARFVNKYFVSVEFDADYQLFRMNNFPIFYQDRRHN